MIWLYFGIFIGVGGSKGFCCGILVSCVIIGDKGMRDVY